MVTEKQTKEKKEVTGDVDLKESIIYLIFTCNLFKNHITSR